MMTPSQIIHQVHGSPKLPTCGPGEGHCYVCGGVVVRGTPVESWMSSNYTDQTRVRAPCASHTCEACVFLSSRTSPVMGRPAKADKQFGGNFRNYSNLWEHGWESPPFGDDGAKAPGYANASKGQKPLIRAFVERDHQGPWFAAIADSGQKHVALYAPMNGRGRQGRVLFDELLVRIPADTGLISSMVDALTSGVTKDEIERGEYRQWTWQQVPAVVERFEAEHARLRGCGWFTLALWLAQRDEEQHAERAAERERESAARPARKQASRGDRGDAGRVPARAKRATADGLLDPHRAASAPVSSVSRGRGRVGEQPAAVVADPRTGQLGLF